MSNTVGSWGRYPDAPQTAHACLWRADAVTHIQRMQATHTHFLPYGNGRSYGDSCLAASHHVLHMRGMDRFISADWATGLVHIEAGMTLGELLRVCVPHGWFLPVTPGTKFATVGGAVANDVHGKNHHVRGTFGRHVRAFELARSDQEKHLRCTSTEHPELFGATIGGLGLTGVILSVELQLMRVQSSAIQVRSRRFGSLPEFFSLSTEMDALHEYTVAWVDCLARGQSLGRGIFYAGDHVEAGLLRPHAVGGKRIPFTPPVSPINRLTLSSFNAAYYHRPLGRPGGERVEYDGFFYPLDGVLEWNRLYGPKGFQQHQCVLPDAHAQDALAEILTAVAASGRGSFLAVLKRCGALPSPGLMSFPMPGVSLALDFAQHQDLNERLFPQLDAIVRDAGGRLYPAKDAHMSAQNFQAFYPQWPALEALRDPALMSQFWKRVTEA